MRPSARLTQAFVLLDPARVAELMEIAGNDAEAAELVAELSPEAAASLFKQLSVIRARALLARLEDDCVADWLNEMSRDAAALLLARAAIDRRPALLARIRQRIRRQYLERAVGFPAHTVGAVVESDIVALPETMAIGEAIEYLRSHASEDSAPVVTLNAAGLMQGLVDLKQLVSATDVTHPISTCAQAVAALRAEMPVAAALQRPEWETHLALPVVDYRQHLLGFVAHSALKEAAAGLREQETAAHAVVEVAVRFVDVLGWIMATILGGRPNSDSGRHTR